MKRDFPQVTQLEEAEWYFASYKKQYERCEFAIKTGNWEGYPESLKNRKETLGLLKEIMEYYERQIQKLK